jgi:hypothetical protein
MATLTSFYQDSYEYIFLAITKDGHTFCSCKLQRASQEKHAQHRRQWRACVILCNPPFTIKMINSQHAAGYFLPLLM